MNTSTTTSMAVPTIKCEDASSPVAMATAENATNEAFLSVNVNLSTAVTSLLAVESACSTPRTPEILNSLIAMSNPLDQYQYTGEKCHTPGYKSGSYNDSSSQSSSSPATSPASANTPSIQKTCSELIKAGLKLSIESKRKHSGSEPESSASVKRLKREDSDDEYDSGQTHRSKGEGLTPEDEERRRRRRERNKIAATKCRLKKRERTVNLVTESEVLESQNQDLKSQLKDLEVQRRQLVDMLSLHNASCMKNITGAPYTLRYDSPAPFPGYEPTSPYLRPESANILASSYTCVTPLNGESSIDTLSSLDTAYMTPHLLETDYPRADSVLSIPPAAPEHAFSTTDGYLPRSTNLLVIDPEQEYYEAEQNYIQNQHHTYTTNVSDNQSKVNAALNDGCLV